MGKVMQRSWCFLIVLTVLLGRTAAMADTAPDASAPAPMSTEADESDRPSDPSNDIICLPGTEPLDLEGDLADRMMDGAHQFIERRIAETPQRRPSYWNRDFSSRQAYERSVDPNRQRLMRCLGIVERRLPVAMERFGDDENPALVAQTDRYEAYQVRWEVLEGVFGEGLLLEPKAEVVGNLVVLPDADQTPEQLIGLAEGVPADQQVARRLAENGFRVVVPVLVSRDSRFTGNTEAGFPNPGYSHREWIYRQAFHMGRHLIGYEVEEVQSVVDWLKQRAGDEARIGVLGYAEGGLIAFCAAAVDTRIDAVLVSGYFDDRQRVWQEPIYRNVWSLLQEFGDAELATLVAPRALVVEYSPTPEIDHGNGRITRPAFDTVSAEFKRIDTLLEPDFQPRHLASGFEGQPVGPMSPQAVEQFTRLLGVQKWLPLASDVPTDARRSFDPAQRQRRQVKQLEKHIQELVQASPRVRDAFFRADARSLDTFVEDARKYRRHLWEEVLGKIDEPTLPLHPRTRQIIDRPNWTGYDVVLDVWPEVYAWGVLLVPKDLKPGERRPVVVCQHGRGGVPRDVIEGDHPAYHDFAARLADRGFIVFAPHNLYRGEDRYRWLDRKANTVKASLFSFILAQHQQILDWLKTLPFVDASRIGFYGLSYGGETAVRVPPLLDDYCLSICSGDFNEWTRKVAATDYPQGFMSSIEWEMPYFDMGNTFGYAELVYLLVPRPFMVERGHSDGIAPDEWVAYEYAKVRRMYDTLGIGDRTEIEYFNGPHTIHGQGTFRFLHKHLEWPEP
jgi:dienelactone hydrolase